MRSQHGRRRGRGEHGDATLSFVLVTPVVLVMIMACVYLAMWSNAQHVVTAAAQEGLSAARVENGTEQAGEDRANRFLDALAPARLVERSVSATRDTEEAQVQVSGMVESLVPGLRLRVHATATAPVEVFRPDPGSP
jgi:Flp pilus assembly protein TadG